MGEKENCPKNGFLNNFKILKIFLRIRNPCKLSKYGSWSM